MRRLLLNAPVIATVFLALIVALIAMARSSTSQSHLARFADQQDPFEIVVNLPFEPEAFHIARLQNTGRIVGIEGSAVHLRAVKADQLRRLSWFPWVATIQSVAQDGQS